MAHRIPTWSSAICALLVSIFASTGLHAAPPASVMDAVELTGWLHVDDLRMGDVTVEVVVDGTVNSGGVGDNGRIDVILPAGVRAVLRFSKPGHLTKEVVVDTHHVNDGGFDGKRRHVSFAVILQARADMDGMTYAGPVGSLGFDDGGGCLTVEHDRRLVPEQHRQEIMVF